MLSFNTSLPPPSSISDDLPKPKTTDLLQKGMETVQEYSAAEEREESRRWRVFRIGDQDQRVDMKAIEPYKKVISHGGQCCRGPQQGPQAQKGARTSGFLPLKNITIAL